MRDPIQVFHLAIPCSDLDEAQDFYINKLGCKLARRYHDRITVNFFGDQLVCHLAPEEIDAQPKMYPRHFGITFVDKSKFDELHSKAKENKAHFFQDLFVRFPGRKEEHYTFFLQDPSNNLLEFKYYLDPEMKY
ncbi:VOC family protein [Legionella londiniensis]|uniref:Glyoxalase/Bleomycin resistance family protein n=1 Tax=Legionella londiniensis TaxID=45068 RepID=A0A0W0VML9_9GAMM|nr:VOC family protein [Legionella londiniensis]KTD21392.1 Glyoxalase/Bleomycin resistance family protein [Legionella londiniensis]STX93551.1 Glyoxalase/Bleomycin resistance family protein [Legionella londiniensis]